VAPRWALCGEPVQIRGRHKFRFTSKFPERERLASAREGVPFFAPLALGVFFLSLPVASGANGTVSSRGRATTFFL